MVSGAGRISLTGAEQRQVKPSSHFTQQIWFRNSLPSLTVIFFPKSIEGPLSKTSFESF